MFVHKELSIHGYPKHDIFVKSIYNFDESWDLDFIDMRKWFHVKYNFLYL